MRDKARAAADAGAGQTRAPAGSGGMEEGAARTRNKKRREGR